MTTLPDKAPNLEQDRRDRPPFTVVVVTYNTARTNETCIPSVLRSFGPEDELIVVDNASKDSTPDFLRSIDDSRVKLQLNEQNVGYSIGMNQGIRLARGGHVVLLNPDTEVPSHWLQRMRGHFRDARVGAVGPLSDRAGGCQRFEFYLPSEFHGKFGIEEISERLYAAHPGKSLEAKTLIGFCMMVSRRAMDAVGLLDEDLVLGNDDLEYCLRLRLAGFKTVVATDVFVRHEEQVSFKTLPSETTSRLVQESTDALARKLLERYGKGKVPSSRALFGVDWFKPSFDLWEGTAEPRVRFSDLRRDPETGIYVELEQPAVEPDPPTVGPLLALTWNGSVRGLVRTGVGTVVVCSDDYIARRAAFECRGVANVSVCSVDPSRIDFDEPFEAVVVEAGRSLQDDLGVAAKWLRPGGRLTVTGATAFGRRELVAVLHTAGFQDCDGDDTVTATRATA